MPDTRILVTYVTTSAHKREELSIISSKCLLASGKAAGKTVGEVFDIQPVDAIVPERLEVELEQLVTAEVEAAYRLLRVPCIVEHAGLVFQEYVDKSYPGGLTKPMWNTLGDGFIKETNSSGRAAVARAVVAYCDGKTIKTFVGETTGKLSDTPKGNRAFYWDTVFIPDDAAAAGRTYAEIVDEPTLGLEYKVTRLSQSMRALSKFLEHRLQNTPELWP